MVHPLLFRFSELLLNSSPLQDSFQSASPVCLCAMHIKSSSFQKADLFSWFGIWLWLFLLLNTTDSYYITVVIWNKKVYCKVIRHLQLLIALWYLDGLIFFHILFLAVPTISIKLHTQYFLYVQIYPFFLQVNIEKGNRFQPFECLLVFFKQVLENPR